MYEQPLASLEPTRSKRTTLPPRLILLIAVGVVGIILVVAIVWWVRREGKNTRITEEQVVAEVESMTTDCAQAEDPESCKMGGNLALAEELGSSLPCEGFADTDRDACVWLVAKWQKDAKLCDDIHAEEQKASCMADVYTSEAEDTHSTKPCARIPSEEARATCEERAVPTTAANCIERHGDTPECAILALLAEAIKKGDLAACEEVPEDLRDGCIDVVGVTDVDRDGLTATDEAYYGTNPLLSDSDGDGYRDKDELQAGFNPNGPGTLAESS